MGENLGYKPDVIQKAKFECSPIGKVFNKGLDESDKKEGLLKRLKNTEGKNKDQGEKQLDEIENQKENKPKIVGKDTIVYLKDKINKLFEMYRKSLNNQSKSSLKAFAKSEDKINYKNLSYKILFSGSSFHIINFF